MMDKIVLGTVQFGMDYGINNKRGQVPREEAFAILNQALDKGIDTVDTARNYGDSERILGDFMRSCHKKLQIVSKLPKCSHQEAAGVFKYSLQQLGITEIYGYLIHNFSTYKEDPGTWDELVKLKAEGRIKKIGFSLYFPDELELIFNKGLEVDIIQFPYSIFDQRFKTSLAKLQKMKVEIYIRSVFLQGLVFKKTLELSSYFAPIKDKIEKLNLLAKEYHLSVFSLCLNFALANEFIDKIVVGLDGIAHFDDLIRSLEPSSNYWPIVPQLSNLSIEEEGMIIPSNWPKEKVFIR